MALINLLRFISLKRIRFQKTQTILSVLGIGIGVSAIVSMGIVNENILASFENTINYSMGRASLQISGAASGFPEEIVDRVREVSGVEHAVPAIEAGGTLYGSKERTIMILGVDSLQDQEIREYKLSDTNAEIPDPLLFLAKADSILLTRELAEREGVKIDQQIRVETIDGIHSFKVRGLLTPEGPARAMAGNMAVMDIFAAQKMFGKDGRIDRIDVSLQSGADLETVRKSILAALPAGYNVETSAGRTKQVENMLSRFRNAIGVTRFVIIFVGMYIIYNSVSVTVVRRKREIGILRALGATKGRIIGLFLAEAVLNGMLGSGLGAGLGVLQAKASIETIAALVSELYLNTALAELDISWTHLAVGFASGITASLLAALFPARSGSRISPIAAIRSTPYAEDQVFSRWKVILLSALFIALAPVLFVSYKLSPSTPYSMIAIFLAGMCVLLGLSLASPFILKIFLELFHRFLSPSLGPVGRLAGLNLQKNIFRNAVAAASVFFGIAMYVNGAGVSNSTKRGAMEYMDAIVKADIIVTAGRPLATMGSHNTPMPFAVMDEINTIPGVSATDPYRMMYLDYGNGRVLVMSMDIRERLAYTDFVMYRGSREDIIRLLPFQDNIVVSEGFAVKHDLKVGDTVTLPTPGGSVSFGVAGVVREYSSDSGSLFMDTRTFQRHWDDRLVDVINVRTTSKEVIPGVIEAIEKKVGSDRKIFALPLEEWRKRLQHLIEDNFIFFNAVSVLTLTIACFGIIVTLFASVLERTREIAILRSIGMLRKQVFRVVVIESMLLGLVGGLLGCLGGAFIGWLSLEGFFRADFGPGTAYYLPYSSLILALVISVNVSALSGIYPAWRAARTNIVEALAYE